MSTLRKILVAVDGSDSSVRAVEEVMAWTRAGLGGELHLVSVQHPVHSAVTTFVGSKEVSGYHYDEGVKALEPAKAKLDGAQLAYQVHIGVGGEGSAAAPAHGRLMVAEFVGLVRQAPVVRPMPGLRAARTGILALLFLVRRRRLRGGARRFSGTLKREHKLDQFFPAQALQINAIHAPWIQR